MEDWNKKRHESWKEAALAACEITDTINRRYFQLHNKRSSRGPMHPTCTRLSIHIGAAVFPEEAIRLRGATDSAARRRVVHARSPHPGAGELAA